MGRVGVWQRQGSEECVTPRRSSEADAPRKLAQTLFTLGCAAVFSLVYVAESDLAAPYWLMLVQMVVELAAQSDMDRVMKIHHLANLGERTRLAARAEEEPRGMAFERVGRGESVCA